MPDKPSDESSSPQNLPHPDDRTLSQPQHNGTDASGPLPSASDTADAVRETQHRVAPSTMPGTATGFQTSYLNTPADPPTAIPSTQWEDETGTWPGGKAADSLPRADYEVLGVLGHGGMGVVYKARQVSLNRIVALKMIRTRYAGPEELARFRVEAEAVAQLKHPHIVQVHDYGEFDGQPFIALEFVDGGGLDKKLAGTPLPAVRAARLVQTLAQTMHVAHEKGIIHRDLKPANVLLQAPQAHQAQGLQSLGLDPLQPHGLQSVGLGVPKITDFGLAKRLDEDAGYTRTGVPMGTPSYMAPEQAEGRSTAIGPWTDVYALGAILYETLTGRPPFKAESVQGTLEQVRTLDPVAPRQLNRDTPRDLETICLKCLHKRPASRYQTAADLADDLGRFLDGRPIQARPVGTLERGVKWVRRRPTESILLALSVLAALGIVGGIVWHSRDLQRRLEERTAEVNGLRDEQSEQEKRARRANQRADCLKWLREGEAALARKRPEDVREAKVLFTRVKDRLKDEDAVLDPDLKDLQDTAERRLQQAEQAQAQMTARAGAVTRFQEFFHHRDEAFFHLNRDAITGVDVAAVALSYQEAGAALKCLGWTVEAPGEPDLTAFEAGEKDQLLVGLYTVAGGEPIGGRNTWK